MVKIVHVMRSPLGGLFRHVLDLAAAQTRRGCQVGLICDSVAGAENADDILFENASSFRLGTHRFPIPRQPHPGDLVAIHRATDIILGANADIIHGHGAKGGMLARLAAMYARRRGQSVGCFYTPHGGALHYDRSSIAGRAFFAFERFASARTDAILFESAYALSAYRDKVGEPACRALVVHNGLKPEEFEPVTTVPSPYDVLFIGELRTLKGVDVLLKALATLNNDGLPVKGLFVGVGPEAEQFRALASSLGLKDLAHFSAPMAARDAFAHAKMVVVPSLKESLPYVVLEACGAGKPVIATSVGGIPEIFGEQAFRLVPPGEVDVLGRAIADMLLSPEAASHLADILRNRVRQSFSLETMASGVLTAYAASQNIAPARQSTLTAMLEKEASVLSA